MPLETCNGNVAGYRYVLPLAFVEGTNGDVVVGARNTIQSFNAKDQRYGYLL